MEIAPARFSSLAQELAQRIELSFKRDVQVVARGFARTSLAPWMPGEVEVTNGDDAAAIPQPDGSYLLLASDALRADFVAADPWFAGYSAVMVNVSDIAAMGGRPWVVVDALYLGGTDDARIVEGMRAASEAFGVPIVGGHTCRTEGPSLVCVSILGKAEKLIRSDTAAPGQVLVAAIDLRGSFRGPAAFNAATTASPTALRAQIGLLAQLAEDGIVSAGKDISNAGLCGTLGMLLESSGVGAVIDLQAIPAPPDVDPLRWLMAFPSYGYVLSVEPELVETTCRRFLEMGVECAPIGTVTRVRQLSLRHERVTTQLLDTSVPLTGFGQEAKSPTEPDISQLSA